MSYEEAIIEGARIAATQMGIIDLEPGTVSRLPAFQYGHGEAYLGERRVTNCKNCGGTVKAQVCEYCKTDYR